MTLLDNVPDRWTVRAEIGRLLKDLRRLRRLERLARELDHERESENRVVLTTDNRQEVARD